jgi:hypothetical protein
VAGDDGSRARSAVKVIAPVALVLVIVGGAIAVRVFRRVSSCSWYSGAWIGLAVATGLVVLGYLTAIAGRDTMNRVLMRGLLWASSLSGVVALTAWLLYTNKYAGCPVD